MQYPKFVKILPEDWGNIMVLPHSLLSTTAPLHQIIFFFIFLRTAQPYSSSSGSSFQTQNHPQKHQRRMTLPHRSHASTLPGFSQTRFEVLPCNQYSVQEHPGQSHQDSEKPLLLQRQLFESEEICSELMDYIERQLLFIDHAYTSNIRILPYRLEDGVIGASALAIKKLFIR